MGTITAHLFIKQQWTFKYVWATSSSQFKKHMHHVNICRPNVNDIWHSTNPLQWINMHVTNILILQLRKKRYEYKCSLVQLLSIRFVFSHCRTCQLRIHLEPRLFVIKSCLFIKFAKVIEGISYFWYSSQWISLLVAQGIYNVSCKQIIMTKDSAFSHIAIFLCRLSERCFVGYFRMTFYMSTI